ncbi:MAG: hypothetical protein M1504_01095 [Candidatus Marsarchaeota archaeon]|nr:hypothetical protein [Candidatus Marsarchaeota archaeon]
MRYSVRINKKIRNVRVYTIVKKVTGNSSVLTKIFLKVFSKKGANEEVPKIK